MTRPFRNPLALLSPGARTIVLVLLIAYLMGLAGRLTNSFNLYAWLALSPPRFWKGWIWQAATYAFLPTSVIDLVISGIAIGCLGSILSRFWSAKELWTYCLVCAAVPGLVKAFLQPREVTLMTGSIGVVFGLLAGWARLLGQEELDFIGVGRLSVRTVAALFAAINLLAMIPCAGLMNTSIMLCGALAGWLFLALRQRWFQTRPSRLVANERINRLEL